MSSDVEDVVAVETERYLDNVVKFAIAGRNSISTTIERLEAELARVQADLDEAHRQYAVQQSVVVQLAEVLGR